jgi:hypothetical protein
MNCKPGDMAFVVRVGDPAMAPNVGAMVRVVQLDHIGSFGPTWEVITMSQTVDSFGNAYPPGKQATAPDVFLQPIRPPKPPEALPAPSIELEKETT